MSGPAPVRYCGPIYLQEGVQPELPAGDGPLVLAYLKPGRVGDTAMRGILLSRLRAIIVRAGGAKGAPPMPSRCRIVETGADLGWLLRHCDVVVNHAGHSFACQAIAAGKRQVCCPTQVEQLLTARLIERGGYGMAPNNHPTAVASAIRATVELAGLDPRPNYSPAAAAADCARGIASLA
jgi:hypothetical protein